jgi:hypothetical protein
VGDDRLTLTHGQNWNQDYLYPTWFADLDELGVDACYPMLRMSDQATAIDLVNAFDQAVIPDLEVTPCQALERLKARFPGKQLHINT